MQTTSTRFKTLRNLMRFPLMFSAFLMIAAMGSGVVHAQSYCTPTWVNNDLSTGNVYMYFTGVQFAGSGNNTSGSSNYSNYTSFTTPLVDKNATVNFSTTMGNGANQMFMQIFADWNQDGDFIDAGERVWRNATGVSSATAFSGSFVVPSNSAAGAIRLRFMCNWYPYGDIDMDPCHGFRSLLLW